MKKELEQENHSYWLKRAPGYSEVNQEELAGEQRGNWSRFLEEKISKQFGDTPKNQIKILDVGAGPGFISIILTELGYDVTSLDFAETMLEQAKRNAGDLSEKMKFIQGSAMELPFAEECYDVILSRNLTWNLPDPKLAYTEWKRVLRKNGMLLVFDANWYAYLFDEEQKKAYEQDRKNVAEHQLEDFNIGENFDQMEEIARKLPLSKEQRPQWDEVCLKEIGMTDVITINDAGQYVYSEKEKINYTSTPLFMISAGKRA